MSSLLSRYDSPENCVDITVTRVNPEIWQSLNSFKKKADLRFANLQQALQKATFATLTDADKLFRITDLTGPTKKELLTSSIDIVALFGHAASEISNLRWANETRLKARMPCPLLLGDEILRKIPFRGGPRQTSARCERNPSHRKHGRIL